MKVVPEKTTLSLTRVHSLNSFHLEVSLIRSAHKHVVFPFELVMISIAGYQAKLSSRDCPFAKLIVQSVGIPIKHIRKKLYWFKVRFSSEVTSEIHFFRF